MQFEIDRERLLGPLQAVIGVLERRQTMPVLGHVLVVAREGEGLTYRTLGTLEVDEVDMLTVALVGSSNTRVVMRGEGPRMYTPRGYARKIDGDLAEGRG